MCQFSAPFIVRFRRRVERSKWDEHFERRADLYFWTGLACAIVGVLFLEYLRRVF